MLSFNGRIGRFNEKNLSFYCSDSPQLAILTGEQLEVIDVDSKHDLIGNLKAPYGGAFFTSINSADVSRRK